MTKPLSGRAAVADEVLWDRRSSCRLARTEAFRLLAAVGRRTSNRVAGILMATRISRTTSTVAIECRPEHAGALRRAEPAIADAVEGVFGTGMRLELLTMPLFQASA